TATNPLSAYQNQPVRGAGWLRSISSSGVRNGGNASSIGGKAYILGAPTKVSEIAIGGNSRIGADLGGMGMYSCPCLLRRGRHGHEYMPMPPLTYRISYFADASAVSPSTTG